MRGGRHPAHGCRGAQFAGGEAWRESGLTLVGFLRGSVSTRMPRLMRQGDEHQFGRIRELMSEPIALELPMIPNGRNNYAEAETHLQSVLPADPCCGSITSA